MTNILKIEGIGKVYADKLVAVGIKSTEKLLEAGCKAKAREEIAAKTGIPVKSILEWANRADLMRIKGIGEEYSDLLEVAGVDTVVELSKRIPENLCTKLMETNKEKKLVRQLPSLKRVQSWVEEAKKLPRKMEY